MNILIFLSRMYYIKYTSPPNIFIFIVQYLAQILKNQC